MTANRAQNYNNNYKFGKIIQISGYHLLILVINQRELCAKLELTPAYVKHFQMFEEFIDLQRVYDKKTYIYERLAEKYGMHTSSVRKVIARLLRTISIGA